LRVVEQQSRSEALKGYSIRVALLFGHSITQEEQNRKKNPKENKSETINKNQLKTIIRLL